MLYTLHTIYMKMEQVSEKIEIVMMKPVVLDNSEWKMFLSPFELQCHVIPCWLLMENSNTIVRSFFPSHIYLTYTTTDLSFVVIGEHLCSDPTNLTHQQITTQHDMTITRPQHNNDKSQQWHNSDGWRWQTDNDDRQWQLPYGDRRWWPQVMNTWEWHDDDCTQWRRLHAATHSNTTSGEDPPPPPINANDGQHHTPPMPTMASATPHQRQWWPEPHPTNAKDGPPTTAHHHGSPAPAWTVNTAHHQHPQRPTTTPPTLTMVHHTTHKRWWWPTTLSDNNQAPHPTHGEHSPTHNDNASIPTVSYYISLGTY